MKLPEVDEDMRVIIEDDRGLFTAFLLPGILRISAVDRPFIFSAEEGLKALEDVQRCIVKAKSVLLTKTMSDK